MASWWPSPFSFHFSPSIDVINLINGHVELLEVPLHQGLTFGLHVSALLKQCSHRICNVCIQCFKRSLIFNLLLY